MRVDKATWRLTSYIVDLIFIIKRHPVRKWHFCKSTPLMMTIGINGLLNKSTM